MKNFNRENGIKWIALLLLCAVMVSTSFVTGCGSDDNGNRRGTTGNRGGRTSPSDSNSGYFNLLKTGRNITYNQQAGYVVDFAIEIFTANDQDASQTYYGPVNAYGYLDYDGPDIIQCGFTNGFWDIETVGPNGIYGTDLTGVLMNWQGTELLARNRADGREARIFVASQNNPVFPGIEFEDATPTVGLDGFTYDNTLWGELIVESVDGIPCYFQSYYGGGDYLRFTFGQGTTP